MKFVRSQVAGVAFANDDGSRRQTIIRKYCRAGKPLEVRLEPDDRYSEDAMGLWVRGRWLLIFPRRYQVGHIKYAIATQIRDDVVRGSPVSVTIVKVNGAGWFRKGHYSVDIEIRVGTSDELEMESPSGQTPAVTIAPNTGIIRSPSHPRHLLESPVVSVASDFLSSGARIALGAARDLATRLAALSRYQKIIAVGFSTCCVGFALWSLGYLAVKTLGLLAVLRTAGIVVVIVGAGIFCLGTVFYLTESTQNPSD